MTSAEEEKTPVKPSMLGVLAAHEKGLEDSIVRARAKARDLEKSAQAQAVALEEASADELAREVTALRAAAAAERTAERDTLLKKADARLRQTRQRGLERVASLARQIVALVLPPPEEAHQ